MKKWNVVLMAPNGNQTITIYVLEFTKTQEHVMNEPKFIYFTKKYNLNKIYSKGFQIISAVSVETDNPNNRIINTYSIKVNHPYYDLKVKSNDKSVF